MRKNKILMSIAIFLLMTACGSQKKESNRIKDNLKQYADALILFDSDLTAHFPFDLGKYSDFKIRVEYLEGISENNRSGLFFTSKSDSLEIERIRNLYLSYDIKPLLYDNDSLFLVGDTSDYTFEKFVYPIPDFSFYSNAIGLKNKRLDKKKDMYILESHPKVIDDLQLSLLNSNLPIEWKHGYSRGIVIDDFTYEVCYWLIIW